MPAVMKSDAMPTLQEITAAHSRRLSELHQRRDAALQDAAVVRDSELRNLPAAHGLYTRFDKILMTAADDRSATEHKAAAARATALARTVDARGELLNQASARRRVADLEALERKMQSETAAEKVYREEMSALTTTTALDVRQKTARHAEQVRQRELANARDAYAATMASAHHTYRLATDAALLGERAAERAAEQSYAAACRMAAAAEAAAISAAQRELLKGLQALDDAREAMDRYRATVNRIRSDAAAEEHTLFTQFREDLRNAGER